MDKILGIPKRQLIANWLMKKPILKPIFLEELFIKLIYFIAGPEPYYWIHYGSDIKGCICCRLGWHR